MEWPQNQAAKELVVYVAHFIHRCWWKIGFWYTVASAQGIDHLEAPTKIARRCWSTSARTRASGSADRPTIFVCWISEGLGGSVSVSVSSTTGRQPVIAQSLTGAFPPHRRLNERWEILLAFVIVVRLLTFWWFSANLILCDRYRLVAQNRSTSGKSRARCLRDQISSRFVLLFFFLGGFPTHKVRIWTTDGD